MAFLILFGIPALIALGFLIFGNRNVTLWEFLAHLGAQAIVAGASIGIIYYANTSDTEVWNGVITGKARVEVHCRHAYPCNCRTVSCGDDCSTIICDTCYFHSYDVDWDVKDSLGEGWSIATIDWQGLKEPPRWTKTTVGEPTSSKHGYTNYLKAAPDSLFRRTTDYKQYKGTIPAYPQSIYDYWHLDRIVCDGVAVTDVRKWNDRLSEINSELGARKQCNVLVVIVRDRSPDWFYALEHDWIGGKKNDIITVVGADAKGSISWVNVMALTKNEMVKVKLRDDIQALGNIDSMDKVMTILRDGITAYYVRRPMEDFAYLRSCITPSVTEWIISLIIGTIISIGLGVFFLMNETFTPEDNRRY